MPYKNKEKQKEFQRKWQKNKMDSVRNATKKGLIPKNSLVTDGNAKFSLSDLMNEGFYKKIKTAEECIEKARFFVGFRKVNQIAIVNLCKQAVRIRKGGDYRSESYQSGEYGKSIAQFAREIGLEEKTMQNWMLVKTKVIDALPKEIEHVDWKAASRTERKLSGTYPKLMPVKIYNHEVTRSKVDITTDTHTSYLRRTDKFIAINGAGVFSKSQRDEIVACCKSILKLLGDGRLVVRKKR